MSDILQSQPKFGPTMLEDGRVRFGFWAPALKSVSLEIENAQPLLMQALADGWFEAVTQLAPGARYRYRVREDLAVADPASRFQPDDVHGPSEWVDPEAYAWEQNDWRGRPWHEVVIYELHVGACGGYAGVQAQLARLANLGITAIELMPLADFPGTRNWGYDGVLPFAPDAAYGTPAQLKSLIDAAHALNLMVYLDVVYNHFGPDGNFLPVYAPQFFREDIHTPWGAAIDFRRPQVRQFYIQNALYWLNEYRFDGLRFDAVHAIEDPTFIDELGAAIRAETAPGRQVHLMLENEHNEASHLEGAFDAQWNDDGHNVLHVLLTGESESYYANYAERPAEKLARCLAEGFVYQGEASPSHEGKPRGTPSDHLPPNRFILFLQNHDQIGNRALGERLGVLAHPHALRAAIALQLLSPQTPLLFMGEEWGSRTPFLFFTDFHDELAEAVRTGRRKEFACFPAFSDESKREQIPDPNALDTFTRSMPAFTESAHGEHAVVFAYYRNLLSLRRQQICPRLKGVQARRSSVLSPHAVVANWRLGDGSKLRIATNLGAEPVPFPRTSSPLLFESGQGCAASIASGKLPGRCTCVFLNDPTS
ncbi:MAG: malto-oligosyltrehalose trehalohydrolase [Panacagrimonas sp.]